jgi:hypothetical protein
MHRPGNPRKITRVGESNKEVFSDRRLGLVYLTNAKCLNAPVFIKFILAYLQD